jgi:hypothetical protein
MYFNFIEHLLPSLLDTFKLALLFTKKTPAVQEKFNLYTQMTAVGKTTLILKTIIPYPS